MRVAIVSYEDPDLWILGKFARKLVEHTRALGVEVALVRAPDPAYDVNHHIIYLNYDAAFSRSLDTLLITHIDTVEKLQLLKRSLATAKLGICMSRQTHAHLVGAGIPADRLTYVLPAHDEIMVPRKLRIGIFEDSVGTMVERLAVSGALGGLAFTIVGAGWEFAVDALRGAQAEVEHLAALDPAAYAALLPQLDYVLHLADDGGSAAMLDAAAAGVETISPPGGLARDLPRAHVYSDVMELATVFEQIRSRRQRGIDAVGDWTWGMYAEQHVAIWRQLALRGALTDPLPRPRTTEGEVATITLADYRARLRRGSLRKLLFTLYEHRDVTQLPRKVVRRSTRLAKRFLRLRRGSAG